MGKLQNRTQELKHQDMNIPTQNHVQYNQVQSNTTSTFLHDVSLRSVSNSKFWMPSKTLLSPSSLRDIWQQNEPQTTNKATCTSKPCHSAYSPLLNSRLISVLSHIVLLENNEWTSSWQNSQLFSRRHNRRSQVPLATFSGVIYPPVFARPLYLDIP